MARVRCGQADRRRYCSAGVPSSQATDAFAPFVRPNSHPDREAPAACHSAALEEVARPEAGAGPVVAAVHRRQPKPTVAHPKILVAPAVPAASAIVAPAMRRRLPGDSARRVPRAVVAAAVLIARSYADSVPRRRVMG